MIEFLFLDMDDTILDFRRSEREAISVTLRQFDLEPTEEVLQCYSAINKAHWEALERKELTREQVLTGRFVQLFARYGITVDPLAVARQYEINLSSGHYFLPGAWEALEQLSKKYKLYLASNGTARVQAGRIASSNISRFFTEIFVSEDMGANKPDIVYFDHCFARIPGFDRSKAMIVGDSLTSDIRGGINAGIATCWVNPQHLNSGDIHPDYQIESLSQLEALLETL